jgi:hypothetical protein
VGSGWSESGAGTERELERECESDVEERWRDDGECVGLVDTGGVIVQVNVEILRLLFSAVRGLYVIRTWTVHGISGFLFGV